MAIFGLFKNKKKGTEVKVETAESESKVVKNETTETTAKAVEAETPKTSTATDKEPVQKAAPSAPKTEAPAEEKKAPAKKAETSTTAKKTQPKTEAKPEPKAEAVTTEEEEIEAAAFEVPTPAVATGYTGKFEINKSKDGKKFFFNLYASNKVGIATSQMYSSAQSALNGVNSVIANAEKAPVEDQSLKTYTTLPYPKWELYVDNGGKYRFRLCASNGSCVCHSQGYTTKAACKNGIDSIIRSSKNAEIDKTYIAKKD